VAVIVDHDNGRILDILADRGRETVAAWLRAGRESGLLAHLEEVTIDMCPPCQGAVREVFGEAVRVTVDRFHVMKNFQDRLQAARRQLQNALPAEAAGELKGARWLWVTNPENLEPDELARRDRLAGEFPDLGRLLERREALRGLFEDQAIRDPRQAESRLREWAQAAKALGLAGLDRFCSTLETWMEGIAGYFVRRSSNGRTEGLNRGLRSILWRACGMSNFAHFRVRALQLFGSPCPQEAT
jgi:transposase